MEKLDRYKLQTRILEVKKQLPESALATFFDRYPEHVHEKERIYAIYNLRSVDAIVTEKFEQLLK